MGDPNKFLADHRDDEGVGDARISDDSWDNITHQERRGITVDEDCT